MTGVVLLTLTALGGCRREARVHTVTLAGSTSVQPFAELLAEVFMSRHPEISVNVQGGGSSAGIEAALSGAADIGMSSRHLLPAEQAQLRPVLIAQDAVAVVVHPSNPVRGLTRDQARDIFAGRIRNWSQVGGPPSAIHVILREEGSGTRASFEEMIMEGSDPDPRALVQDSNGAVRETVAHDPGAIGYISLGLVDERVRPVSIDGMTPSVPAVLEGRYQLVRPFLFVLKGEPREPALLFLDFVLGPGQAILREEGLIPAAKGSGNP
ncbi:MAG: phosphate ABC transporter substrate-binding protein [Bacillota bacterium]|nr:phosphate ABC transporter substrate-binding protein [Bacillota bacterium]